MCRQHAQVRWWAIIVALLVAITWGTSGCGSRPPQVEIVVSPSISTLEVDEGLALAADATGEGLKYQWKLAGPGELLEPTTDPAVVYEATEPGDVVVTVEVTDKNDQMTTKSYSFVVEPSTEVVERPIDTPKPEPTEEPTAEPTLEATEEPMGGPALEPTEEATVEPASEPTEEAMAEPTVEATATPMPDAVVVANANLRSGPGTVYDIISTFSPGQVLTVTGRITDATWLQVNTEQMQEGWVINRADLVTLNFLIEQIPIVPAPPMPTPPTVADFNSCAGTNNLGGPMGAAYNAPDQLIETYVLEQERGCVARLEYNITEWSAFWMKLQGVDLTPYNRLTFDIRADPLGIPAGMKIELKRANNTQVSIIYMSGITADWQTKSVNLSDFGPTDFAALLSSFAGMEELVFTFEASLSGTQGVVYLDNIVFRP